MNRRKLLQRPSGLLMGAFLGVSSLAASAQSGTNAAPTYSEGTVLLPQVSIVGSKEAASKLPASGYYLGSDELKKHNISDINRAVRQIPGVYVREEDGFGLFPNISLRGVTTERMKAVTVMEDGILSAPAPYSAPSAYYSPNVARMDGFEVLKGSSQIKYGPYTTGGAINYLSTPFTQDSEGYLKLSYGSYHELIGHFWYGDVKDLGDKGKVGFLVEGHYQSNDGFKTIDRAPDFTDTDNTGFTRVEPMVKLFWDLPTSVPNRLEFKYGFTDLDADETYLGLNDGDFRADPNRRYSSSRFDNIQTRNHRASIRHIVHPSESFSLETTGYLQYFDRNWEKLHRIRDTSIAVSPGSPNENRFGLSRALANVPGDTLTITPDAGAGVAGGAVVHAGYGILTGTAAGNLHVRNNNRSYELYGIQSVATKELTLGGMDHEFQGGVRYHYDQVDRFQWEDVYTQNAAGAITAFAPGAAGGAGDRIQETHAVALHLQDEIKWNKFTIVPGIRLELLDQQFENGTRVGAGTTGDGNQEAVAGGISVGYELSEKVNLFGGVHRGFSFAGPRSSINNNLSEETSLSFETGTRYNDAETGVYAEAIGFYTAFDDLIVGGNLGGGGAATTENVGDINSIGLELAAGYDHGRANSWAVKTPTRLSITLTDAQLDGNATNADPESIFAGGRDGSKVPYVPEYQLNAEVGLEYGKVSTFLSATYVPQTYTTAANTRHQVNSTGTPDSRVGKTDNYFVVDWTVRYAFRDNTTLFGGVKNMLNREYIASRHPHGPRPGLPRFFNVGLEMNF